MAWEAPIPAPPTSGQFNSQFNYLVVGPCVLKDIFKFWFVQRFGVLFWFVFCLFGVLAFVCLLALLSLLFCFRKSGLDFPPF